MRIFTSIVAYFISSGLLVFINVVIFGKFDVLLGKDNWPIYWALWSLSYFPAVIVSLIATRERAPSSIRMPILLCIYIIVILSAMQFSFLLNLDWPVLLAELIIMSISFTVIRTTLVRDLKNISSPNQSLKGRM